MKQELIKAAVIGDPIEHSLSPKIHNYFLRKYQINGQYKAIKVTKEDFEKEVKQLIKNGYRGFNITIPHKEAAIKLCDHLSQTARLIGAVNTISILDNGNIFGHNSDAQGFIDNLKYYDKNLLFKNKTAFVIGAGGGARAVIYALINENIKKLVITNRNEFKAQKLIEEFKDFAKSKNCQIELLPKDRFEKEMIDCDILVNTTSLGMLNCNKLSINLINLPKSSIVNDIVYNPLMTDLLKMAQNNGSKIITGIGMLVFQALIGFEIWFGKKVEFEDNLIKELIQF
jgi:shikimate dehydrogenase